MERKKVILGGLVLLIGLMLAGCAVYGDGYYEYPYYYDHDYGYPYYGHPHEFGEHHDYGGHHEGEERHHDRD